MRRFLGLLSRCPLEEPVGKNGWPEVVRPPVLSDYFVVTSIRFEVSVIEDTAFMREHFVLQHQSFSCTC